MAQDGDDSVPTRKRRPRLASDLLEPGMVIAQPSGLEEALARELDVLESTTGAFPLNAEAFGRTTAPPAAPVGRGPPPGRADSTELYEPPTVRLDLEGPPIPDPATMEIPMPAARRLNPREPTIVQAPIRMMPTAAMPNAPRAVPLSLARPSETPKPRSGMSGLPLGAGPIVPVAPPVAVRPNLPCNLLLVDQDLKAGSQLAAKLMEFGYTCRVVGEGLLDAALAQQRYDAAIVEITADEARQDLGHGRLSRLSAFSGPIVLTSAAQLPASSYGPPHRVRGSLMRPFFTENLVGAIEDARSHSSPPRASPVASVVPAAFPSTPPPPPPKPSPAPISRPQRALSPAPTPAEKAPKPPALSSKAASAAPLAPATAPWSKAAPNPADDLGPIIGIPKGPAPTPGSQLGDDDTGPLFVELPDHQELFQLDANVVRAVVMEEGRANSRGRVRAMSAAGRLLVETKETLDDERHVSVELTTVEGLRAELRGIVVAATDTEMGIELEVPPEQRAVLRRFLDEARDMTQPTIEQVRIKALGTAVPLAENLADEASLEGRWREIKDRLDDDVAQQRFIQDCLKAKRLEFAVQSYRALKAERPEDPTAAKYLQQVGTILAFYALRKEPDTAEKGMPIGLKLALGLFVIAVLMIWVIVELLR